jgi:hypothetical protein
MCLKKNMTIFDIQTKLPKHMKNKRLVLLAVLLMLSVGNFTRIVGNENIRTVQFLSIFAIGALTALLIKELAEMLKK